MATKTQPRSIVFSRRAKVWRSELAVHRVYRSECQRFEVVEVRWNSPAAYGRYWLAVGRCFPWTFVERRRTRAAAEKYCRQILAAMSQR